MVLVSPGISASGSPPASSPADLPWQWPLDPTPPVLRHFDKPPKKWMAGHRGADLAATRGSTVLSPADGVVVFIGTVVDRPVLTIDHGNGLLSSFEPVAATVGKGERVRRGQPVGDISTEPHCPTLCLHWGVREEGEYVNPLNLVSDRRPSVLLPLSGPDWSGSG